MPAKTKRNAGNYGVSKIIFLILIAATVAVGYGMDRNYIKLDTPLVAASENPAFAPTGFNIPYSFDSKASFYSDGTDSFFYCTIDGLKYMSQDGTIKENSPFTMTSPILLGRGSYACVAEAGGRSFGLYDKNGKIYGKEFNEKILYFSLNENGYVSILLVDGSLRQTLAFDPAGNEIFGMKHETENIFPMASDVSLDGRIIAMSFANINKVELESNLVFYYLNKSEKSRIQDSDGMFRAIDFKDQLIPTLRFMNGNALVYISDIQMGGIFVDEKTTDKDWKHELNNKLDAVTFIGSKNFAAISGDPLLNRQAEAPGILSIYDTSGKRVAEYATDPSKKNNYLYSDGNGLIIGNGREFHSISLSGKFNYSYNSAQDVTQLLYLGNVNTLLQNTSVSAEILRKTKSDKRANE